MASIDDIVSENSQLISTASTSPIHASAMSLPQSAPSQFLSDLSIDIMQQGNYKVDAGLIINVFTAAKYGFSRDQCALFKDTIEKCPVIRAHLNTRKLALLATDWSILGGTNQAKRDAVRDILMEAGITQALMHLSSALEYGFSCLGQRWGSGLDTIREFTAIEPINIEFRPSHSMIFAPLRSGERIPLDESNKHWFVVHAPKISLGLESTIGLMRTLMWIYIYMQHATREKARYLEQYGVPFLMGTVSESDFRDTDRRNQLLNQLYHIGANGAGLCTQGMKIEALNVQGSGSGTNGDFVQWIQHNEDLVALLILGQVASSGPTGGFSKGQLQGKVLDTIVMADTKFMSETITNQVIRPLEEAKYGTHELRFDMTPMDWEQLSSNVKTLQALGLKPKKTWIEDKFGVPLEDSESAPKSPASIPELPKSASLGLPVGAPPISEVPNTPPPQEAPSPEIEMGAPLSSPLPAGPPQPMNDLPHLKISSKIISFADDALPKEEAPPVDTSMQDKHNQFIDSFDLPEDIKASLRATPEDTPESIAAKVRDITYANQAQSEDLAARDEYERLRNEALAQLNKSVAPTEPPKAEEKPLTPPPQVLMEPVAAEPEPVTEKPQEQPPVVEEAPAKSEEEGRAPRQSASPLAYTLRRGSELLTSELPPDPDELQDLGNKLLRDVYDEVRSNEQFAKMEPEKRKNLIKSIISTGQELVSKAATEKERPNRGAWEQTWAATKRGLLESIAGSALSLASFAGRSWENTAEVASKALAKVGTTPTDYLSSIAAGVGKIAGTGAKKSEDVLEELRTGMENDPLLMASKEEQNDPMSWNSIVDKVVEPVVGIAVPIGKIGLAAKGAKLLGVSEKALPSIMKYGFMADAGITTMANDFSQDFTDLKAKGASTQDAYSLALFRGVLDGAAQSALAGFQADYVLVPALRRIMGDSSLIRRSIDPSFLQAGLSSTAVNAAANAASTLASDLSRAVMNDSKVEEYLSSGDVKAKQQVIDNVIDSIVMSWPAFFLGGWGRGRSSNDIRVISDAMTQSPADLPKILDHFGVTDSKVQSIVGKLAQAISSGSRDKANRYFGALSEIADDTQEDRSIRIQADQAQSASLRAISQKFKDLVEETGTPPVLSDLALSDGYKEFINKYGSFSDAVRSGEVEVHFVNSDEMKAKTKMEDAEEGADNKATLVQRGDKNIIYIDGSKVSSVDELHDLLSHEDFVHRFLYGAKSAIPEARRSSFEDLVSKLSEEKGNGFWDAELEAKYRDVVKRFGKKEAEEIESRIREEKVARFIESGVFKRYESKGEIGKFVHSIVLWFKRTFPQIFGKMNDEDIASTISDIYRSYQTPTKAPAADMRKKAEIVKPTPEAAPKSMSIEDAMKNVESESARRSMEFRLKNLDPKDVVSVSVLKEELSRSGIGLDTSAGEMFLYPLDKLDMDAAVAARVYFFNALAPLMDDPNIQFPRVSEPPVKDIMASVSTKAKKAGITRREDLLFWNNNEALVKEPTLASFKKAVNTLSRILHYRLGILTPSGADSALGVKADLIPTKAYPFSRLSSMLAEAQANPQHPLNDNLEIKLRIYEAEKNNDADVKTQLEEEFAARGIAAMQESFTPWYDYLGMHEAYPESFSMEALRQIASSVVRSNVVNGEIETKKYKRTQTTEDLMPSLDPEALADVYTQVSEGRTLDIAMAYHLTLKRLATERTAALAKASGLKQDGEGFWIKIPSKINDEANFNTNVGNLMAFSQGTPWCTGRGAAGGYLSTGDFYIYRTPMSDGAFKSRIAIRMSGNAVSEVRGVSDQSQNLEPDMFPVLSTFATDNKLPKIAKWVDGYRAEVKIYALAEKLKADPDYVPSDISEFDFLKKEAPVLTDTFTGYAEYASVYTSGYDKRDLLETSGLRPLLHRSEFFSSLDLPEVSPDWTAQVAFPSILANETKALLEDYSSPELQNLVNNPALPIEARDAIAEDWIQHERPLRSLEASPELMYVLMKSGKLAASYWDFAPFPPELFLEEYNAAPSVRKPVLLVSMVSNPNCPIELLLLSRSITAAQNLLSRSDCPKAIIREKMQLWKFGGSWRKEAMTVKEWLSNPNISTEEINQIYDSLNAGDAMDPNEYFALSSLLRNPNVDRALLEKYRDSNAAAANPTYVREAEDYFRETLKGGSVTNSAWISFYAENPLANKEFLDEALNSGGILYGEYYTALKFIEERKFMKEARDPSFLQKAEAKYASYFKKPDDIKASVSSENAFKRFMARKGINNYKEFVDAIGNTSKNFEPGWLKVSGSPHQSAQTHIQEELLGGLQKLNEDPEQDGQRPVYAPKQENYARKMSEVLEVPNFNLDKILAWNTDTYVADNPEVKVIGRGGEGVVFTTAEFPFSAFKVWPLIKRYVQGIQLPGMGYGATLHFNKSGSETPIYPFIGMGGTLQDILYRMFVQNAMRFISGRFVGFSKAGDIITAHPIFEKKHFTRIDDPDYFERTQMMLDARNMVDVTNLVLGDQAPADLPRNMLYASKLGNEVNFITDLDPGNVVKLPNGEYRATDVVVVRVPKEYLAENPELVATVSRDGDLAKSEIYASVSTSKNHLAIAKRTLKNVGRPGGAAPSEIGLDKWLEVGRAMGRKEVGETLSMVNEYVDHMVSVPEDRDRLKKTATKLAKSSRTWDIFANAILKMLDTGIADLDKHHNNIASAAYIRRLAAWGAKGGEGTVPFYTGDWGDDPAASIILQDGKSFYNIAVPKDETGSKRAWSLLSPEEKAAWNSFVEQSKAQSEAVKQIVDDSMREDLVPSKYRDLYEPIVRDALNSEMIPALSKSKAREALLKIKGISNPDVALEKMFNLIDKVKDEADALKRKNLEDLVRSTVAGELSYLKKISQAPGRAAMPYEYNKKLRDYLESFTTVKASSEVAIAKTQEAYLAAEAQAGYTSSKISEIKETPEGQFILDDEGNPTQDRMLSSAQMDRIDALIAEQRVAQNRMMQINSNPALVAEIAAFLTRKDLARVEDMTNDQLRDILEDIMIIKKSGTLKKELLDKQKASLLEEESKSAIKEMSAAEGLDLTHSEDPTAEINKILANENAKARMTVINRIKSGYSIVKNAGWSVITPEFMLDWMSGFKSDSALMRNVFHPINSAINDCFKTTEFFTDELLRMYTPCWNDLAGSLYANKFAVKIGANEYGPLSMNNLMFIYANAKNPDNLRHLTANFGDDTPMVLKKVSRYLPKSVKSAIDAQIAWYSSVQYPMINKEFKRVYGIDMPKIENYFPIRNLDYDTFSPSDSIIRDMRNRMEARRNPSFRKQFEKERVEGAEQKFKSFDYFGTVNKNMSDVAWYVAANEKLSGAASFITQPGVAKVMQGRSEEAYRQIGKWIEEVTFGREKPGSSFDTVIDMLRRNTSVASLGGRVVPILNQIPSWALGMKGVPPSAMARAAKDLLLEPGDFYKTGRVLGMIYDLSPFMKNRPKNIQRELAERIAAASEESLLNRLGLPAGVSNSVLRNTALSMGVPKKILDKIPNLTVRGMTELSMLPMNKVDQGVAVHVWLSHFYANESKGPEEAAAIADAVVRKTQSLGDWRYASSMFRSPGAGKLFTLFLSPLNRQMNAILESAYKVANDKDAKAVERTKELGGMLFFYLLAPAYVSYAAQHGSFAVEDEREATEQLVSQLVGGAPIVNNIATGVNSWIWSKFIDDPKLKSEATMAAKNPFTFSLAPLRVFSDAYSNPSRAVNEALGLPLGQALTFFEYANNLRDVSDWRAAVWSPAQLRLNINYPVGMALRDPVPGLDAAVREYNKKHPTLSWHPVRIRESLLIKTPEGQKVIPLSKAEVEELRRETSLMFRTYVGDPSAIAARIKQMEDLIESGRVDAKVGNRIIEQYKSRVKDYSKIKLVPEQVAQMKSALSKIRKEALSILKSKKLILADPKTGDLFHHDGLEAAKGLDYHIIDEEDEDDNPALRVVPEAFNDLGGYMTLIPFSELDPSVQKKAEKLIEVGAAMSKLQEVRSALMEDLMPVAAEGPIEVEDGSIVYVDGSEGKTLGRNKVMALLMDRLKISREAAIQLIDQASDKKLISPYLKIIAKKNPKLAETKETK